MSDTVEILQAPAIVVEIAGPAGPQGPSGSGSGGVPPDLTILATQISDSSSIGRSVLRAASTLAARTAIGAASSTHVHAITDVTNLENALNGKASTTSVTDLQSTVSGQITDLQNGLANHSHPLTSLQQSGASTGQVIKWDGSQWAPAVDLTGSGTTGAVTSVAGRTNDVVLGISDIGNLASQLAGKAASDHGHEISQINNLSNQLSNKANLSHQHTLSQITDYTNLYLSAVPDATNSVVVGGAAAAAASTWKTRTISQALDTILFPTIAPTISTPKSVSLEFTGTTGVQEVGIVVTRTLTATFNRGRITNGNGQQGPELVGAASSYAFSGTGMGSTVSNGLGSLTISPAVISGSNQWNVTATHAAGTGPYTDNKNVASTALDASRAAGTASGSTAVFTGVYPWYYIKSPISFTAAQFGAAITALGGNTSGAASGIAGATITRVLASASGTLVVPYNVSNQFFGVAYDNGYTSKTTFFVTSLNSGEITGPFNTNSQSGVNQAATAPRWTNRTFTVHISKTPLTDAAANIELRNT